jgi:hypothetical protein
MVKTIKFTRLILGLVNNFCNAAMALLFSCQTNSLGLLFKSNVGVTLDRRVSADIEEH